MPAPTHLPHNQGLKDLSSFSDASQFGHIAFPCGTAGAVDVQVAHAVPYMEILSVVKDVAALAVAQAMEFFDEEGGQAKVIGDRRGLFGKAVGRQAMLSKMVVVLDGLLASKAAFDVEASPWKVPCGLQPMRHWAKLVAVFAGKC